jgi:hypothetical protein
MRFSKYTFVELISDANLQPIYISRKKTNALLVHYIHIAVQSEEAKTSRFSAVALPIAFECMAVIHPQPIIYFFSKFLMLVRSMHEPALPEMFLHFRDCIIPISRVLLVEWFIPHHTTQPPSDHNTPAIRNCFPKRYPGRHIGVCIASVINLKSLV